MKLDRYYYITSLPALGELGTKPPIEFGELREHLRDDPQRQELVNCLFLLDDLLQREAYLAGELKEVAPTVLTQKQARNESPLPTFLLPEVHPDTDETTDLASSEAAHHVADETWEAYFRHVAHTAGQLQCPFLTAWVRHEVTLRNALVSARAKRLEIDESEFLAANDLVETGEETSEIVSDWETAATPLTGYQALIRARWDWLEEHDRYFTFRDDELAAYALRLMLLKQWSRVTGDSGEG